MGDQTVGNRADFPDESHEISLVDIANFLLRNWKLVVLLPLLLALAVGLWTLTKDRTYSASASFVPQGMDSRSGGTAAALAQQFGVDLGSDRMGQSPEFYADLLRSRAVLREAVEAEYEVEPEDGILERTTLVGLFETERDPGVAAWQAAVEELRRNISVSVARETGVVRFQVSAFAPELAEQIAGKLLEILDEFNTAARQERAQEETRFISGRLAEAQAELLAAESALQAFLSQNRRFRESPELVFEHDRLQRQVLMQQEIYTSLLRSREQARIDAVRDTPLFTVIDDPTGTAEPESRYTLLRALLGFMGGLVLAVFIALGREMIRHTRRNDDPRYRELRTRAREVVDDLSHPRRVLTRGGRKTAGDQP